MYCFVCMRRQCVLLCVYGKTACIALCTWEDRVYCFVCRFINVCHISQGRVSRTRRIKAALLQTKSGTEQAYSLTCFSCYQFIKLHFLRGVDAEAKCGCRKQTGMDKAKCGCRKRSVDAESEVWMRKAKCGGVDAGTLTFLLAISAATEAKFSPSGFGMR